MWAIRCVSHMSGRLLNVTGSNIEQQIAIEGRLSVSLLIDGKWQLIQSLERLCIYQSARRWVSYQIFCIVIHDFVHYSYLRTL